MPESKTLKVNVEGEENNQSKDENNLRNKLRQQKEGRKDERLKIIRGCLGVSAFFVFVLVFLAIFYQDNQIILVFSVTVSSIITTLIGAVIGSSIE